ncbi:MAG: PHP domain-containing protein [Oscillospiraceae bacterium]|nr:PHP domain-containing protein [Oscillospiraceae bacterium]
MGLFKYETHIHTRQGSACGNNSGAEMAEYYKSLGYSGFVVTDHFDKGNTAVNFEKLPWEDAVESFCEGFEDAKRRGDKIGVDVFFGFEYCYGQTEFLIYGFDKEQLLKNPQIFKSERPNLKYALSCFKEAGALVIHAHPFRERPYIDMVRLIPDLTDAVETYNAGDPETANHRAEIYADMYGLVKISGGDVHCNKSKTAGIEVKKPVKSLKELIKIIKAGEFSLIKS